MTYSIGFSLYVGRLRRKRDTKHLILSRFDEASDFFNVLKTALKANLNQYIDVGDKRRRLQVNNDILIDGRSLDGTLDIGEYGISSTMRDAIGETSFQREPQHAEMIPLFYRAWCPEGQDFSCFALQNFGPHGCKIGIERLIVLAFKERFPEFHFEMREIISKSLIEHFLKKGSVREFTFLQHGVPSDWASGYGGSSVAESDGEIEIRIKAKRGKSIPWPPRLSEYFSSRAIDSRHLFELNNFKTDSFKVRLDVDGQSRTLSHTEFFRLSSRVDITDRVGINSRGHPNREELRPIATELIKQMLDEMATIP